MRIVSVRRNYQRHIRERSLTPPDRPDFYVKGPCRILASGEAIPYVPGLIFEGELAVIIGAPAIGIPGQGRRATIRGYAAANDLIVRDLAAVSGHPDPRHGDWAVALGRVASPPSLGSLAIEVSVNGVLRVSGRIEEMLFDIPTLLTTIGAEVPLEPGDVILTGCIGGVDYLRPGDSVEVTLVGISRVSNWVEGVT